MYVHKLWRKLCKLRRKLCKSQSFRHTKLKNKLRSRYEYKYEVHLIKDSYTKAEYKYLQSLWSFRSSYEVETNSPVLSTSERFPSWEFVGSNPLPCARWISCYHTHWNDRLTLNRLKMAYSRTQKKTLMVYFCINLCLCICHISRCVSISVFSSNAIPTWLQIACCWGQWYYSSFKIW